MTEVITLNPRVDVPFEAVNVPVAPSSVYSSPVFNSTGIAKVFLNVWSNNSSDSNLEVVFAESTTGNVQSTTQVYVPIKSWTGNAIVGGLYYFASAELDLTSSCYQFYVIYPGTSATFTFNASIRIGTRSE